MNRLQLPTSNFQLQTTGRILPYALFVTGVVLVAFAFLFFWGSGGESAPNDSVPGREGEMASGALDTSAWAKYQSEQLGFSIKHPPHWKIAVAEDEFTPAINIFDPATAMGAEPPFTHFSEVTHVSIYPRGIPTEGVFSNTRESAVRFGESVRAANDFLLENGSAWATAASFSGILPAGWDEAGFLWAKVVIDDLDLTCRRGMETVPVDVCDPFSGDTLVRRGKVSAETRAIEEAMLASFHFLNRAEGGMVSTSTDAIGLSDLIRVIAPEPGAIITSPLTIRGEARGTWYFEATFPVVLVDWDGRIIAEHYAEAKSDWMTTEFVPFEAVLEFKAPPDVPNALLYHGKVILSKDNPSGLPEHDAAIEIPIRFAP